jgi:hypothetical protein
VTMREPTGGGKGVDSRILSCALAWGDVSMRTSESQSARGLAHSKTLRAPRRSQVYASRPEVRQPSAAFFCGHWWTVMRGLRTAGLSIFAFRES